MSSADKTNLFRIFCFSANSGVSVFDIDICVKRYGLRSTDTQDYFDKVLSRKGAARRPPGRADSLGSADERDGDLRGEARACRVAIAVIDARPRCVPDLLAKA